MPCVPLFCSYHILTSSVIYYWTDAQQLGIYLLTSKDVCTFYVPHTTSCQVNLHDMISEYYIDGSDLHSMTQTVSPIIISIATQTSLSVLTTFRITSRWLREGLASNSSAGLIFLWVWEKWCLKNKAFPLKYIKTNLICIVYQPGRNIKISFPECLPLHSLLTNLRT